ncbi:MAG: diguanylate cyclase, partial [Candidatus Aegiribacteria sp.]|nr:diguanylate cyclase [Candidatus Aegiribacteria sp.]
MDKKTSSRFNSVGIDPLTGLHDRSFLENANEKYLSKDKPWSLLMLDVDHFKLINDIYGHLTGDKVLRQTALTIQVNLKESDTAVRFGGDEFIVILPDTDEEGALNLAQRLIYEIKCVTFTSGLHLSLSIGVSQSRITDRSIMDLVSRADKALYKAKETGRGRFFFFTEDLTETNAPDISFSHLVGRRPELQKLRQLLEESVTDSSRFAIVSGEAGVGKTRLVNELLNYCDFIKSVVVRNSVMEYTQSQPFSLLIEPVREVLSNLTDSELNAVRTAVEPVHPATLDLFPDLQASVMDETIYFREERLRFRIFRDISVLLAAVSSIHPITIILDNLQWVTKPDLAILSFVARNTPDANILYLCILRKDELSDEMFKKLSSISTSLPLLSLEIGKMTVEETRNMILFSLKDPNVPSEVQEFLISQSGGNPLFLRELITSCVDSGYITCDKSGDKIYNLPDDLEVPDSIGQIITLKLSAISREAVELLKIVSLSPDQFTLSLLEGMTGRDKVELARRLDESIKDGLIEEFSDGRSGISFRFTHGAVRDYLSADLPDSLKLTYHQRMAAYFEGFFEKGRKELLIAVAYHYSHSQDDDHAARYALLAANQAFNRGANRDAIHWYTIFLDRIPADSEYARMFTIHINLGSLYSITGEVDKADSYLKLALKLASNPRELAAVHLRLGRNNLNSSLYPETLENYDKAVKMCMEGDSADPIVFQILIETLIETSFVHRLQGNYDEASKCLDRVEKALEEVDTEIPEDVLAMYYTRKADVISELDSEDEALELYERALEIYKRIDDMTGQATVLNNMHAFYSHQGDYATSLSTMEEVIRMNIKLDDKLGLATGYYNIAEYYQEINMLDLAREYYDKYMELNDIIKNELGLGYGRYGLGKLHWLKGELEKSRFYFEDALEIFEKLRFNQMKASCDLMIAQIYVQMDKFDEAKEILDSIDDDAMNPTVNLSTLYMKGLVQLHYPDSDRESHERAAELLRKVIDSSKDHSEVDTAMYYSALESALRSLGRDEDMIAVLREGSEKLAGKLQRIRSYSIRNSIMTRREIAEFIDLCRSNDLPFPPDGFS